MPDVSKILLLGKTLNIKDEAATININNINDAINTINRNIATTINKRYVLIADSLGEGMGSSNGRGWTYYFKDELGLTDSNCYIAQQAGYGFYDSNYGFKQLINGLTVANANTITDVICLGGLNDSTSGVSSAGLINAVNDFVTTAKNKFPNAEIHIGCLGRARDDVSVLNYLISLVMPALKQARCHYIAGSENLCHQYWRFSDNWHLTDSYYEEIGRKIARNFRNYLSDGVIRIDTNCTMISGASGSSYLKYSSYINDNNLTIYGLDGYIGFTNAIQLTGQQEANVKIATQGYNTLIRGNNQPLIPGFGLIGVSTEPSSTIYFQAIPIMLSFSMSDSSIYAGWRNVVNAADGYYQGYLRSLTFKGVATTIDSMYG